MTNKANWKNYGDVNPLDHGGIWVMSDEEKNGSAFKGCYYVKKFIPETMEIIDAWVEITDDWIDKKAVQEFAGSQGEEGQEAEERYAIDCLEYYGYHELQGESTTYETIEEVQKELEKRGIVID